MRLKRLILPTLLAVGLVCATAVIAADNGNFGLDTAVKNTNIPTGNSVAGIIGNVLTVALTFVGTIFLLIMIYAGFVYMTARGDEKKVGEAKKMITGAIIGVLLIGSAYTITKLVITLAASNNKVEVQSDTTDDSTPECTSDSDCTDTAKPSCNNGSCEAEVDFAACTTDADCPGSTCDTANSVCN